MIKPFNVLSKEEKIDQSLILEASAGTGKTFSLQHLYVRHLLHPTKPLKVNQILVVTFTRAAVRELRTRIRDFLRALLHGELPEYVVDPEGAKSLLREALDDFDEAEIYTIHGFATRMLKQYAWEAKLPLDISFDGPAKVDLKKKEGVREALRALDDTFSPAQIKRILSLENKGPIEEQILRAEAQNHPDFDAIFEKMRAFFPGFTSPDFDDLSSHYKKMVSRDGEIHKPIKQWMESFSSCIAERSKKSFDALLACGNPLKPLLTEENLKKGKTTPPLALEMEKILPLIDEALDVDLLKERVSYRAKEYIEKRLLDDKVFGPDEILQKMHQSVGQNSFVSKIQIRYQLAMIDEFQDTDVLQWEIFKELFVENWEGILYLVGDPKQSIYLFRKADIYTYLDAVDHVGERRNLVVNWRSHPKLVEGLNALFSTENVDGLIELPQKGIKLTYYPVEAAKENTPSPFPDNWGSIHFIFGDGDFLPFITQEIQKSSSYFPLSRIAIIVKDRYQAKEAKLFLEEAKIPASIQKKLSWKGAEEILLLKLFLQALEKPTHVSTVKTLLGSPLVGWNSKQIQGACLEDVVSDLLALQGKSLFAAADAFLKNQHPKLMQLVGVVQEYFGDEASTFSKIHNYLDRLYREDGEEVLALEPEDAVTIITMHMSKGLEYDVVFAYGFIQESSFVEKDEMKQKEIDAEKMRQLYVVMTRSVKRLYIPVVENKPSSLIGLYLSKWKKDLRKFIEETPLSITSSTAEAHIDFSLDLRKKETPPPEKPKITRKRKDVWIESFTSLHQRNEELFVEGAPKDWEVEEKTPYTLPAGKEVGILIHSLLEKAPLHLFKNKEKLYQYLEKQIPHKEWIEPITSMLFDTFHAPLPDQFTLSEVNYWLRETDFLFTNDKGWRTGLIDAVIFHNYRYYLLDWKTNWLGPTKEHYQHLEPCMAHEGYYLQASIYREALEKYLDKIGGGEFGGTIYLFLRGPGVIQWK